VLDAFRLRASFAGWLLCLKQAIKLHRTGLQRLVALNLVDALQQEQTLHASWTKWCRGIRAIVQERDAQSTELRQAWLKEELEIQLERSAHLQQEVEALTRRNEALNAQCQEVFQTLDLWLDFAGAHAGKNSDASHHSRQTGNGQHLVKLQDERKEITTELRSIVEQTSSISARLDKEILMHPKVQKDIRQLRMREHGLRQYLWDVDSQLQAATSKSELFLRTGLRNVHCHIEQKLQTDQKETQELRERLRAAEKVAESAVMQGQTQPECSQLVEALKENNERFFAEVLDALQHKNEERLKHVSHAKEVPLECSSSDDSNPFESLQFESVSKLLRGEPPPAQQINATKPTIYSAAVHAGRLLRSEPASTNASASSPPARASLFQAAASAPESAAFARALAASQEATQGLARYPPGTSSLVEPKDAQSHAQHPAEVAAAAGHSRASASTAAAASHAGQLGFTPPSSPSQPCPPSPGSSLFSATLASSLMSQTAEQTSLAAAAVHWRGNRTPLLGSSWRRVM
jgi:hypothetical protein